MNQGPFNLENLERAQEEGHSAQSNAISLWLPDNKKNNYCQYIWSAYSGPGPANYCKSIIILNYHNRSMSLPPDIASILLIRKLRLADIRKVEYGLTAMKCLHHHCSTPASQNPRPCSFPCCCIFSMPICSYKTVRTCPSAWFPQSSIS